MNGYNYFNPITLIFFNVSILFHVKIFNPTSVYIEKHILHMKKCNVVGLK